MTVKQTKVTTHNKPIYFVELAPTAAGTLLVTNTETSGTETGPDGFPIQYRQAINMETGACTCGCKGFQESITRKAAKAGEVPSILNGYTCKHIRRAAECGEEWGYLEPIAQPEPEVETTGEEISNFDYYAFFEGV